MYRFLKATLPVLAASLLLACGNNETKANKEGIIDADSLHFNSILVDTHNDVLWGRVMQGADVSLRSDDGHSDLIRFKEGGLDVQIFSVFCDEEYGPGVAFNYANTQIDSLYSIIGRNQDKIALARTASDVRLILEEDKIAALIGVEGGHMIEDKLENLDSLYKRGMAYLTLTWNNSTSWATSAADETNRPDEFPHKGLNEFGRKVVKRLNELGVMVDVSHVGEQTFYDAISVTNKPIIASHSNAHALDPVPRNLKDDQLKAIAKNGGVVCVNFYSGFVDNGFNKGMDSLMTLHQSSVDSLKQALGKTDVYDEFIDAFAKEVDAINPSIGRLVDHIDHIVRVAGIDHVGIGADYDGTHIVVREMHDVTTYPILTSTLIDRGYSESDIKKILGENVLRVLEANHASAMKF